MSLPHTIVAVPQARNESALLAFAAFWSSGSGWLHAYVPRAPHDDAVLAALRARTGDTAYEEARAWGGSTASGRPGSTHWSNDRVMPKLMLRARTRRHAESSHDTVPLTQCP